MANGQKMICATVLQDLEYVCAFDCLATADVCLRHIIAFRIFFVILLRRAWCLKFSCDGWYLYTKLLIRISKRGLLDFASGLDMLVIFFFVRFSC